MRVCCVFLSTRQHPARSTHPSVRADCSARIGIICFHEQDKESNLVSTAVSSKTDGRKTRQGSRKVRVCFFFTRDPSAPSTLLVITQRAPAHITATTAVRVVRLPRSVSPHTAAAATTTAFFSEFHNNSSDIRRMYVMYLVWTIYYRLP